MTATHTRSHLRRGALLLCCLLFLFVGALCAHAADSGTLYVHFPDGCDACYFDVYLNDDTAPSMEGGTYYYEWLSVGTRYKIVNIRSEGNATVDPSLTYTGVITEGDKEIVISAKRPSSYTVTPTSPCAEDRYGEAGDYRYDVYENGTLVAEDHCGSFSNECRFGTKVVVKNIRTPGNVDTDGIVMPASYQLSKTTAEGENDWTLSLPDLYRLDVNLIVNGNESYNSGLDDVTFTVTAGGITAAAGVTDFCDPLPAGFTYEIKDITVGGDYTLTYTGSRSGALTGNTEEWIGVRAHKWSAATVTSAPTAENAGEIQYTCSHCGEVRSEWVPLHHSEGTTSFEGFLLMDANNKTYALTNADGTLTAAAYKPNSETQRWRFEHRGNGFYRIISVADGKALTLGTFLRDGRAYRTATLAAASTAATQQWVLQGNFSVVLYNRADACALDLFLPDGATAPTVVCDKNNNQWGIREIMDYGESFTADFTYHNDSNRTVSTAGTALNTVIDDFNGEQWQFTRLDNGAYKIVNAANGKALTAAGTTANANVKCAAYTGANAQQWYLIEGENGACFLQPASTLCVMDLTDGNTTAGTNIQLYTLHYGWEEQWDVTRYEDLGESFSAYVFNAKDVRPLGYAKAGSVQYNLEVHSFADGKAKIWTFTRLSDGGYRISTADGTLHWTFNTDTYNVELTAATDNPGNRWYLYRGWDNCFTFRPGGSARMLDLINGGEGDDDINVQTYDRHTDAPEQWSIQKVLSLPDRFYAELYLNGLKKVLSDDVYGEMAYRTYTGSSWQRWLFTKQADGSYRVQNAQSGRMLAVSTYGTVALEEADSDPDSFDSRQHWQVFLSPNGCYTVTCDSDSDNRNRSRFLSHPYNEYISLEDLADANVYWDLQTIEEISSVTLNKTTFTYTGAVQRPTVTVKNAAGKTLTAGVDYTLTPAAGSLNAGSYTVTVTGKGGYTGTVSKKYTIKAETLTSSGVTLYAETVTFNGKVRTPSVTVKNAAGTALTEGTDYTVTVPAGRTNAGTYPYKIVGKGNYTGTVNKTFTILPQSLSGGSAALSAASVAFNGKVRTPALTVKNAAGDTLTKGTDYTVAVPAGRKNVGSYTYTVTGTGNYKDTLSVVFKITAQTLTASNVTLYAATVEYNGKVRTPTVTVKNAAGETLTKDTDYTLTVPAGRTQVGVYNYKVVGKGNYAGSVTAPFTIKAQTLKAENVTLYAAVVRYNGKQRTPTVTVKNAAGETLENGTDYTVAVPAGRTAVGAYTYTITGKGKYTGTVKADFVIQPATEALTASGVTLYAAKVNYNGKARTPAVTVKNAAGQTLTEGKDYTVVVPEGRTVPGTYPYTVKGMGTYTGSVTKDFVIAPYTIKGSDITLYSAAVFYNGSARAPKITVTTPWGATLVEGTHYTVSVPDGRKTPGTYTYTVTAKGTRFTGTATADFVIKPYVIKTSDITLYSAEVTYNGKVRTPAVTVKTPWGATLTEGTHYTVSAPAGRTNTGNYIYTITAKGARFTGTANATFTVSPQPLKAENAALYSAEVVYNGKQRTPTLTVKNAAGDVLTNGTDYTVSVPAGRTEAGTYVYKITGKGNYSGTISKNFIINAVDTRIPTAKITATNALAASQTVTLTMHDEDILKGYYWGTNTDYTKNTYYGLIDYGVGDYTGKLTVSAPGKYYLKVVNRGGFVSETQTITFCRTTLDASGGTVKPAALLTAANVSINLPTPSMPGFRLQYWTATTGGDGQHYVTAYTPTASRTLLASWEEYDNIPPTLTLSSTKYLAMRQDLTITLGDETELACYYFGANADHTKNTKYTLAGFSAAYTKTITAKGTYYVWVEDMNGNHTEAAVTYYETTLNANGGVVTPEKFLTRKGDSVTLPLPERNNFTFKSWEIESPDLTSVSYAPVSNRTLSAVWQSTAATTVAAPTNVQAKGGGTGAVKITWTPVANAVKYLVYRSTSANGSYSYFAEARAAEYTDTSLTDGTVAYYKIKAVYTDSYVTIESALSSNTYAAAGAEQLKAANVTLYSASVTYNGKQRTPTVTVKNAAGETLVSGVDYEVTVPAGRTDPGTYVYQITGIGAYKGTVSKNFVIKAQ